ncbi:ComEA family DNA-binding protein [Maribacter sp. 2210JD10-5]|uniref:ComEA family DNA-binding protein n=1 Tax=Maribacter sp. 2210JD10-5 TaxID=3386272 RepID=UPI0039BD6F0D
MFQIDDELQKEIDALKKEVVSDSLKIYSFNPNYISDYKGYTLGMSVEEIDRLHLFRSKNKYVNSVIEFQQVTGVSDSLLYRIGPYFKFPDWIKNQKQKTKTYRSKKVVESRNVNAKKDLNTVSVTELKTIYGIGDKLSARILKFRDRLGGFLVNEQLYDTYGLEKDVADRVLSKFEVKNPPIITKININSATAEELSQLIYIQKNVAWNIVNYRNDNGAFISFDELLKIKDFPADKIDRIKLYLTLKK